MNQLPRDLQNVITDYAELPHGILSTLSTLGGSRVLPELPLELKQLIASYQKPATKEDLLALYTLGPPEQILKFAFATKDPDRVEAIQRIIFLPETTMKDIQLKLGRALEWEYLPVVLESYKKLPRIYTPNSDTTANILNLALKQKDYEVLKGIISLGGGNAQMALRKITESALKERNYETISILASYLESYFDTFLKNLVSNRDSDSVAYFANRDPLGYIGFVASNLDDLIERREYSLVKNLVSHIRPGPWVPPEISEKVLKMTEEMPGLLE